MPLTETRGFTVCYTVTVTNSWAGDAVNVPAHDTEE